MHTWNTGVLIAKCVHFPGSIGDMFLQLLHEVRSRKEMSWLFVAVLYTVIATENSDVTWHVTNMNGPHHTVQQNTACTQFTGPLFAEVDLAHETKLLYSRTFSPTLQT